MIFSVYLKHASPETPESVKSKIRAGSDICVNVAIELSDFIIQLNKKVRMAQPVLFISSYLESTSTVILFYTVSSLPDIAEPLVERMWRSLQDTRNFLNGGHEDSFGSTSVFARKNLESLQEVLKRENSNRKTHLTKIMDLVGSTPSGNQLNQDTEVGLEAWLQTLDWISYS